MEDDKWGNDPAVQIMRRVFATIEANQTILLDRANVNRLDSRLGRWRRAALEAFEGRWVRSARFGVRLEETDVADLYLRCLEEELQKDGIGTTGTLLPNPLVEQLLENETDR